MGASASKAARQTAGGAARKYPARPSPPTTTPRPSAPPPGASGPTVHPEPHAATTRDAAIEADASDPNFAQSLRSLGPVQPTDIQPPSSRYTQMLADKTRGATSAAQSGPPVVPDAASNPALQILAARQRWQDLADREAGEIGQKGFAGRRLMDASTLRRALVMQERGQSDAKIEDALELKPGTMALLGRGIVAATEVGRE